MGSVAIPAAADFAVGKTERMAGDAAPLPTRAARFLLVLTLMAAPMAFGAVESWAWASLGLIAALLLVLWALGCVQRGHVAIRTSLLYIPAALLLLLGIVQLAGHTTLDPFQTREALVELATDLVFFFLAGQLWADASDKAWKLLGLAVAVYAVAISLFAIIQCFSSRNLIYWAVQPKNIVFGPYVNHDDYAGLMEMLIPVGGCYAIWKSRRSSKGLLLLCGLGGAVASVLLSGSRGGVIVMVLELAFLGVFLWRRKEILTSHRGWVMGLLCAAAAAVMLLAITPWRTWRHLATVEGLASRPNVTLGNRLAVSRDALAELRDYPWLGTGMGSFEAVFPQYETFATDLVWHHAHDDYVEALTETGVAGGVIILLALALFASVAFRNLHQRLKGPRVWVQLGATLGCCGLLVHSFVDFNLHIPANAAWFAVCSGLLTVPAVVRPLKADESSIPMESDGYTR